MEAIVANAQVAAPAAAGPVLDPFAGAALPALTPVLNLAATIFLFAFIIRKGFELSFGGK